MANACQSIYDRARFDGLSVACTGLGQAHYYMRYANRRGFTYLRSIRAILRSVNDLKTYKHDVVIYLQYYYVPFRSARTSIILLYICIENVSISTEMSLVPPPPVINRFFLITSVNCFIPHPVPTQPLFTDTSSTATI